jgi:hypothetical protein
LRFQQGRIQADGEDDNNLHEPTSVSGISGVPTADTGVLEPGFAIFTGCPLGFLFNIEQKSGTTGI